MWERGHENKCEGAYWGEEFLIDYGDNCTNQYSYSGSLNSTLEMGKFYNKESICQ